MSVRGCVALLLVLATFLSVRVLSAQPSPGFGQPLPGLAASLQSAFEDGRQQFTAEETAATGLGPLFNARSCAACHTVPLPAGSAADPAAFTVRFGREVPLYGLGLIQAIPESTIVARADPDDRDGEGITGRPNISNGLLGRFGWKAAVATGGLTTSPRAPPPAGDSAPHRSGLRARRFYLHDGRATDLAAAIALHGGEASSSRASFAALSPAQKADLLAFLRSL